jgi:TetR/AcrR family transcriptional regulator
MSTATSQRLPAAERRRALVEAALRVFSNSSYDGATTAEIAREAGVSEPILYRHFASKRELYFACLDEGWRRFRAAIEEALAAEPDPSRWADVIPRAARTFHERGECKPSSLWVQAINQAAEDPEIRKAIRKNLREAHSFFEQVISEAQARGGIPADRDPSAEAWISLGVGLLRSISSRVGGLLTPEDFAAIGGARSAWLTGK